MADDFNNKYNDGMWATVYTDISMSPETKVSAWAAWCNCSKGRKTKTGECQVRSTNTTLLEFYGIAEGIQVAYDAWKDEGLKGILVKCDNASAIKKVWPWTEVSSKYQKIKDKIEEIRKSGVEIRTGNVKGHQGGHTTPSWINEWCDTASRNKRKKIEKAIRQEKRSAW
jgi:hypothetical protein